MRRWAIVVGFGLFLSAVLITALRAGSFTIQARWDANITSVPLMVGRRAADASALRPVQLATLLLTVLALSAVVARPRWRVAGTVSALVLASAWGGSRVLWLLGRGFDALPGGASLISANVLALAIIGAVGFAAGSGTRERRPSGSTALAVPAAPVAAPPQVFEDAPVDEGDRRWLLGYRPE